MKSRWISSWIKKISLKERENSFCRPTWGHFLCLKRRMKRFFQRRDKTHLWAHKRTFCMCEEWVVSFLDENIFLKGKKNSLVGLQVEFSYLHGFIYLFIGWKICGQCGTKPTCELTHGLFAFVGGGGGWRWFFIWMKIIFL